MLKISETSELFKKIEINPGDFKKDSKAKAEDDDLVRVIKEELKIEKDENKIRKAIGIVEKYSLPVEQGCGVYEIVPDLVHSCRPNTYYSVSKESQEVNLMVFRASVNIRSISNYKPSVK